MPNSAKGLEPNPTPEYLLTRIQRLEDQVSALREASQGKSNASKIENFPARALATADARCLPLRAWFRGAISIDAPCQLSWDASSARLAIRSATPANTEEIDVASDVRSINYTDPDEIHGYPIVAIVCKDPEQQRITLQLDSQHPDGYRALVAWLKTRGDNIDVSSCRSLVAETIWDTAARVTQRRVADRGIEIQVALPVMDVDEGPPNMRVGMPTGRVETVENASASTSALQNISHPTVNPPRQAPAPIAPTANPWPGALQPRGRLKAVMKPTQPLSATLSGPPAGFRPKPSTTNKPADKTMSLFLPIKAWYLGHKYFDEPYHVVWGKSKMAIRSGEAPGSLVHHTEEVDIDMAVETVWYVEPNEHYPNNVIVLETYEKFEKSKIIGAQFSSYFKQGAIRGMGQIVIKFDGKSSGWDENAYKTFVNLLKSKTEKRGSLRGKAGDAKWEAADRVAQLAEVRVRREGGAAPNATPKATPSTQSTTKTSARSPQKPYLDPDEVILVYPPRQTGAVNITNADLTRLAPGEFLNDTLIEFGLKLWLQQLEKDDPELVKQIHVFSSFFYKKLNKENALEGYESVRKWTSKFDLFDKKYIIIPINENLHWYLAIIYHPECILLPPPPTKSPSTRRKAREQAEHFPELDQQRLSRPEESIRPPDSKSSQGPAMPDLDTMDVDAQDDIFQGLDPLDFFTPSPAPPIPAEVKTNNDYGSSAKSRGKRKAGSPLLETFSMQEFPPDTYDEDADDIRPSRQPQTYVFTLDSLGSRHPKVVNVLSQYLQFEARERKNIPLDLSSKAVGKMALVPHQPNLSDAGIYLLHFAQTFISAPLHYYNLITMKKGNKNSLERQSDWNDERTKMLREGLTQQIAELSIEWKKNRAAKEESMPGPSGLKRRM
ncbi:hypothetical protein DFH09DRAFT_996177 [Mycena vulgaris]|nr:hypothetical protein DFH09DRAFT_996177 [Mycena vulgaris]